MIHWFLIWINWVRTKRAAIFLILELSQPFTGLMRISDPLLRDALPRHDLMTRQLPPFR
jgi:hypothetical protein